MNAREVGDATELFVATIFRSVYGCKIYNGLKEENKPKNTAAINKDIDFFKHDIQRYFKARHLVAFHSIVKYATTKACPVIIREILDKYNITHKHIIRDDVIYPIDSIVIEKKRGLYRAIFLSIKGSRRNHKHKISIRNKTTKGIISTMSDNIMDDLRYISGLTEETISRAEQNMFVKSISHYKTIRKSMSASALKANRKQGNFITNYFAQKIHDCFLKSHNINEQIYSWMNLELCEDFQYIMLNKLDNKIIFLDMSNIARSLLSEEEHSITLQGNSVTLRFKDYNIIFRQKWCSTPIMSSLRTDISLYITGDLYE